MINTSRPDNGRREEINFDNTTKKCENKNLS